MKKPSPQSVSDFLYEAKARMIADGLLPDGLIADGSLHCCGVSGKERGKSGRYVVHIDGVPTAWWKNWKSDAEGQYSAKSKEEMTAKERREYAAQVSAIREKARQETEQRHKAAARLARAIWKESPLADNSHAYLARKQVSSFGLKQAGANLVVPVYGEDGAIQSLQYVLPEKSADGLDKFFLAGGKTLGGYFAVPAKDGGKDGPLLICEGYATGASLAMATGHAVLIAFNAGNLLAVSRFARARYPQRKLCLCADYDVPSEKEKVKYPEAGGIGVAKAKEAAQAIGGHLAACPSYSAQKQDFNDLHCREGLERVAEVIRRVMSGEPANASPIPAGFSLVKRGKDAGLYWEKVGKDGVSESIQLGPPLEVLAATRDDTGNDWGQLLRWHDSDGREHTLALADSLLASQGGEWLSELAYGGWKGFSAFRRQILEYLVRSRAVRRVTCVNRIGWHNDCYVLPYEAYGGDRDVVLQSVQFNDLYDCNGDYEAWRQIPALCKGNSRLVFAVACAFAGPFLRLCGMEGGGISFEGASSSGKTTAIQCAASVWGSQKHVRSWRGTDNGLEGLASLHNDNVLILDEISQASAKVVSEATYMLSNGQGKARAGRSGGLRKSHSWRVLILSTGELGIADKLAEDGKRVRAGQSVRFCGVPTNREDIEDLHGMANGGELVRSLKELCQTHYGYAGREFVQKLTSPDTLVSVREKLPKAVAESARAWCPVNADAQVERAAMRFALCGYAGTLAETMGILPEGFAALDCARACFLAWLDCRGGHGSQEDMEILANVRRVIEQHGASRFQDMQADCIAIYDRIGFIDKNSTPASYIVLPEQFKAVFCAGHSQKRVVDVLNAHAWLLNKEGKGVGRVRIPIMGRKRAYVLQIPEDDFCENT